MIPELGHYALTLALALAIVQSFVPLVGSFRGNSSWMAVARPSAYGQFFFMMVAFLCLAYSFIMNDFSVGYVAHNSNTALPTIYRISAVWGAHEGSLLLWALMLSGWGAAVALFSRGLPSDVVARVLGVLAFVAIGFLLFMLLTSNPFERLLPIPADGRDLNPLLQDFGLVIHPPLLYMGYVGFAVAFAFAIAALLGGRLDAAWARWSRPWTLIAWAFLTLGITLGSWWAYYELGWGGWWFWDPVENASFMPWLVGTALVHSLIVSEKRGAFKNWTVLLAIFAFSLSLLGTFLVRSGVLTSVHAFATDPARGVFILMFLVIVVGSSLVLYAVRAPQVKSTGSFKLVSREAFMLINNVLLLVTAGVILLGTLYPLIIDALGLGKLSVGPPYFNSVFLPLTAPLAFMIGIGPLSRWKQQSVPVLVHQLRWLLATAVLLAVVLVAVFYSDYAPSVILGVTLAIWIALTSAREMQHATRNKQGLFTRLASLSRSHYGMTFAHLGVAIFVVGVTLTSTYSVERDVKMMAGDSITENEYTFTFVGVKESQGPNYIANTGEVRVSYDGEEVAVLRPEKRVYTVQRMPMTEAAIDPGLFRDLYVALGEPLDDGAWAVRVYHKPFVRWLWLGGLFMAFGGLLAASDRRYRSKKNKTVEANS
ncbi:c-type cytochrome biogenesis protein CcmF [Solemya pervernicosa gill symbiont]|uniref:C-type cytochrome biogenesis protein CcmF n=2 Tax=Gammaproteobacteria incertae sedis TaxID=118884 RepID=A0A1T2L1S2_9GAMM|nr:heme lyase CcmF/NrfE family subunit [Candidatus Reidiella endopervernicosa]OOZ39039.1 c-type cytochrome biogenesis protein CcmF [Solemya pervernicosa gill symbiont]QKQ27685.1 heme lyase CcmF/NrfE family subunit [Candidatus Reidiella endopervernicosa]